jgi:hypothetical protein
MGGCTDGCGIGFTIGNLVVVLTCLRSVGVVVTAGC